MTTIGVLGYKPSDEDVLYLSHHPDVSVPWLVMKGDMTFGRAMMNLEQPEAVLVHPDVDEDFLLEVLGTRRIHVIRTNNIVDAVAAFLQQASSAS